jgi:hypothetical protein
MTLPIGIEDKYPAVHAARNGKSTALHPASHTVGSPPVHCSAQHTVVTWSLRAVSSAEVEHVGNPVAGGTTPLDDPLTTRHVVSVVSVVAHGWSQRLRATNEPHVPWQDAWRDRVLAARHKPVFCSCSWPLAQMNRCNGSVLSQAGTSRCDPAEAVWACRQCPTASARPTTAPPCGTNC